jgi:hypothetical protein
MGFVMFVTDISPFFLVDGQPNMVVELSVIKQMYDFIERKGENGVSNKVKNKYGHLIPNPLPPAPHPTPSKYPKPPLKDTIFKNLLVPLGGIIISWKCPVI